MSDWKELKKTEPRVVDWYLVNTRYYCKDEKEFKSMVTMAFKDGDMWLSFDGGEHIETSDITHWQPIPDPPTIN